MRIYLQTVPAHTEAPRYCQLSLEQDLLGGWTLYREAGIEGGRASLRREQFFQRDDAVAALEKNRDAQLKRGYQPVAAPAQDSLPPP